MTQAEQALRRALAQAAMCEHFDAQALVAALAEREQATLLLQQLAQGSCEVEIDGSYRWTLGSTQRQAALGRMSRDELRDVLHQAEPLDALGLGFAAVLGLRGSDEAEIAQRYRAAEFLREANIDGDAVGFEQVSRTLRGEIARDGARASLHGTLRTPLRGRKKVLQFLREFAAGGARAIESQHGTLPGARLHRASLAQRRWPLVPALLLSGIGGVGKSALVAELVRVERGEHWDGRVVVHLDFDEPALKAGAQGAMTLHLSRQLALARPTLDGPLAESRARLRERLLEIERSPTAAYERLKFALHVEMSAWAPLLRQEGVRDVLFVLDTLEEVTIVGLPRLQELFDWLDLAREAALERVAVVASGRALVPEGQHHLLWPYFLAELDLGDISRRSGRDLLRDRFEREGAARHIDSAWRCVETFGSNPLVLCILARYCTDKDEAALQQLLDDAQSAQRQGLAGEMAQKFLYSRILERVRDEDIRPLANPGLVLRRVTPELIRDVLAIPCGLGAVSEERARELLEKLQKLVWLVTPDGDGVRHRPDVRRAMLPLIWSSDRSRAEAVAAAAEQWYAVRADAGLASDPNRLDSWYYAGLQQRLPESMDERQMRQLADHLGEQVDDLPLRARARIKSVTGRTLGREEIESLPQRVRDEIELEHGRVLVGEGLESVVNIKKNTFPNIFSESAGEGAQLSVDFRDRPESETTVRTESAGILGASDIATSLRALFAMGQFEQVANQFEPLLERIWTGKTADPGGEYPRLVDEPVYLAAICARFVEPDADARRQRFPPPDRLPQAGVRKDFLPLLWVLNVILWREKKFEFGVESDGTFARRQEWGGWQHAVASLRAQRRLSARLCMATLPFMHLNLLSDVKRIDRQLGLDLELSDSSSETTRKSLFVAKAFGKDKDSRGWGPCIRYLQIEEPMASQLQQRPPIGLDSASLTAVDELARIARYCFAGIEIDRSSGGGPYVGLVTELYAPIRSALRAELNGTHLAYLVGVVFDGTRGWPKELNSQHFAAAAKYGGRDLIPQLLTVADYFGRLGDLVRTARHYGKPGGPLDRMARFYDSYESIW